MSKPSENFPKQVDLKHRVLTPEEQRYIKEALGQGWIHARGEPDRREKQMSAWQLVCYENRADCVCVEQRGKELWLEAFKMSHVPLSRIFAEEKQELCRRWCLENLGRTPVRVPKGTNIKNLVQEVLDLFARDRTPLRNLELRRKAHEGMAQVVDASLYWSDLEPGQMVFVYIIPIAGKPGRCVALRHKELPLVDVPLEHFRLLDEDS